MRRKSNSTPARPRRLSATSGGQSKHHAADEKIRIVLDGLRGETSIAELWAAQESCTRSRSSPPGNEIVSSVRMADGSIGSPRSQ